ncbi:hypothetical protein B9J78_01340 [bacterium Unc6]|nr:hypothetical protein [bacterium Unc6]
MKKKSKTIIQYDGCWKNIILSDITKRCKKYLKSFNFAIKDEILKPFISEELACRIALCRITDIAKMSNPKQKPFPAEISLEYRILTKKTQVLKGLLYDGFMFQHILRKIYNDPFLFIYITDRLMCTMGQDGRYHARTIILGNPAIVSTTGLVEGPAKVSSYYRIKFALSKVSPALDAGLEKVLEKNYLLIDDKRINKIIPGYILQAIFFHWTGEPFCSDKMCRLYNAHWQKEMLECQLQRGVGLCEEHRKKLGKILCMMNL